MLSTSIVSQPVVLSNDRPVYTPSGLENINKSPSAKAVKDKHRTDKIYELYGGNYFPVSPAAIGMLGLVGANVLGRIVSYCQMKNKNCTAPHARIAAELGLARQTVTQAIGICLAKRLLEVDSNWKVGMKHTYTLSSTMREILAEWYGCSNENL